MAPAEPVRQPVVRGRTAVRTSIGLAVVAAGVVLLGAYWLGQRGEMPAGDGGDMVRVGVVEGQTVPGYLDSSRAELSALTDPSAPASGYTWALISLADYRLPADLPGLLDGVAVAQVLVRVPIPDAHTQVVRLPVYSLPADALAGMRSMAVQRDQERAEYLQLSRKLTGGQERARRAYETAAHTAEAEAAAYRSGCACVLAAVARGTPAALQQVAARPGIRVVDPAPEVHRLDRAEFRPPLPEQDGTVPAEPRGSAPAVPNDSSGIASRGPAPILSSLGSPVTFTSPAGLNPLLESFCPGTGGAHCRGVNTLSAVRTLDRPVLRSIQKRNRGWSLGHWPQ